MSISVLLSIIRVLNKVTTNGNSDVSTQPGTTLQTSLETCKPVKYVSAAVVGAHSSTDPSTRGIHFVEHSNNDCT